MKSGETVAAFVSVELTVSEDRLLDEVKALDSGAVVS